MKTYKLISSALLYCSFCSAFQLPFEHPRPAIARFLLAAQDGNLKVVQKCLPTSSSRSPLFYTFNPSAKIVDINKENTSCYGIPIPPLVIAAKLGKAQALEALLRGHATPDIIPSENKKIPPLIVAILEQQTKCAQEIRFFPWTPEISSYNSDLETFPHCVKRKITSQTPLIPTLEKKDYRKDHRLVRILLTHGARVSLTQQSVAGDAHAFKHRSALSCFSQATPTAEDVDMYADLVTALYKETREKRGLVAARPTRPAKP